MKQLKKLVWIVMALLVCTGSALAGSIKLATNYYDYIQHGLNPNKIEPWEDGRRVPLAADTCEWWYLQAETEDGLDNVVVVYQTQHMSDVDAWWELAGMPPVIPLSAVNLYLRDGRDFSFITVSMLTDEGTYFKEGSCDLQMVPFADAKGNDVSIFEPAWLKDINGDMSVYKGLASGYDAKTGVPMEVRFTLTRKGVSYRPGTGIWEAKDDLIEKKWGWIVAVPNGEMQIEVILNPGAANEEVVNFSGFGYHDHNFMNVSQEAIWDGWIWAHGKVGNYSYLVGDMRASQYFDDLGDSINFVVFDSNGQLVLSTATDGGITTSRRETYFHEGIGKTMPSLIEFNYNKLTWLGLDTCKITLKERDPEDLPAYFDDPVILTGALLPGIWPRTENVIRLKETWGIKPQYSRVLSTVTMDIDLGQHHFTGTRDGRYEFMDLWGEFPIDYDPIVEQARLLANWDIAVDGLYAINPKWHYRFWGRSTAEMETLLYFSNILGISFIGE